MQISVSYEALLNTINGVSSVVEDAQNAEEMKNIIFKVEKGTSKVKLIGVNQYITFRSELPEFTYEVECDEAEFGGSDAYYMQMKSKELFQFLNAFKGVRRTKVERVKLIVVQHKIKLVVVESDLETGVERNSTLMSDNLPVKQSMLKVISTETPKDNVLTEDSSKILMYTSSVLPIMQNGNSLYSSMVFGEDSVVAFNPAFTVLCTNMLCDVFKGITLPYRAVSFLKAVIGQLGGYISVVKTDAYICCFTDGVEAFIRYDRRVPDYSKYKELCGREHAVSLDRLYFKDVLRRLCSSTDAVELALDSEKGIFSIRNSRFEQEIPIIQSKGLAELGTRVAFKILPDVLNKVIIGEDSEFSNLLYIYITPTNNGGFNLMFTDDSGFWSAVARTR